MSGRDVRTDLYEPAEDSYLLATACAPEIDADERVLDVGTGTGIVAEHVATERGAEVVGVDVNPIACRHAAERGVAVVRGDLVSAFRSHTFDVMVCNPPYLPTSAHEERPDWLSVATSGGPTGRAVVAPLLRNAPRVLRQNGRLYLLASSLMDLDTVRATADAAGFAVTEIAEDASFPFEVLSVLRCAR